MTILDTIKAATIERVARCKNYKSIYDVRSEAEGMAADKTGKDFAAALRQPGLNIIAELKKASPSKGVIAPDFEKIYLDKARRYEEGGAAAISCLTEPEFFFGSDEYLRQVRKAVALSILRKDFTVDEYQLYEAKTIGADAVLLICSILNGSQLAEYLELAKELQLAALVEVHDAAELKAALASGAELIGVNNRNLKDFTVDTANSLTLRQQVPQDKIFVAESGITSADAACRLQKSGVNAALVGEALMRSADAGQLIKELRGE